MNLENENQAVGGLCHDTVISLTLNGKAQLLPEPMSLQQVLNLWGYTTMTFAVARNGEFVPRGTYGQVVLQAKDEIEIVAPIQGG